MRRSPSLCDLRIGPAEHVAQHVSVCSPTVGAIVGSGSSSPTNLIGVGSMSAPSPRGGIHGRRSWNCGSSAMVFGVFDGAIGVLCSMPELEPLGRRARREDVAQDRAELGVAAGVVAELRARPALEQVHPADALAEVLPELPLRRHEQHVAVGGRVELVADARLHARGARRAALVVVGRVAGDLRLGPLVRLPRLAAEPVDRGGGVGLRDLELAALAGLAGPRSRRRADRARRTAGRR